MTAIVGIVQAQICRSSFGFTDRRTRRMQPSNSRGTTTAHTIRHPFSNSRNDTRGTVRCRLRTTTTVDGLSRLHQCQAQRGSSHPCGVRADAVRNPIYDDTTLLPALQRHSTPGGKQEIPVLLHRIADPESRLAGHGRFPSVAVANFV